MDFDAFISYSHSSDGELAPDLQRGLQQLAKPWSRRQALRVFRDDTGLSVSPALWASITDAMESSHFFILMASPAAAQSEWVNREIRHWMATQEDGQKRILPVVTEGTWVWDDGAGDIDFAASTAAPSALAGVFAEEPRHLDLAWARGVAGIGLSDPRFRDAVADIAAPIHGIPKDELEGEAVRQHRRTVRIRRIAIATLVVLVLGLGVAGCLAVQSAEDARNALRDLEDANGNIVELEAQERQLEAAIEQAAADLGVAESAKEQADELAATAQREAEEAVEARAEAESALSAAEVSRARAESAQARAEREQASAEAARDEATVARAEAEAAQAAAEEAAAEAEANEAAARQAATAAEAAERTARAAEAAARAAEAQAEANEEQARAAEEQARLDEAAARTAETAARAQEEQARTAQAAAEAAAATAREAEATALAAEQVAREAQSVAETEAQQARDAEAVAKTQQAEAETAAAAAAEAQAAAEALRAAAEEAALAAALAQTSAASAQPDLSALMAVESFCVTSDCTPAVAPAGVPGLRAVEPGRAGGLQEHVLMLSTLTEYADVQGLLPGWSGRAVQLAVSDDGDTVAALRSSGSIRLWTPADPDGREISPPHPAVGIDLTPDGAMLAYVTAQSLWSEAGEVLDRGSHLQLYLMPADGAPPAEEEGRGVVWRWEEERDRRVRLEVNPQDPELVLVTRAEPAELLVSWPVHRHPFPDDLFVLESVVRLGGTAGTWRDGTTVHVLDVGTGSVEAVDGTVVGVFANPVPAVAPTVAVSRAGVVAVGYDDGSVAAIPSAGGAAGWTGRGLTEQGVRDIALDPRAGHVVVADGGRSLVRSRLGDTGALVGDLLPLTSRSGSTSVAGPAGGEGNLVLVARDLLLARVVAGGERAGVGWFDRARAPSTAGLLLDGSSGAALGDPDGEVVDLGLAGPHATNTSGSTIVYGDRCAPYVAARASPSSGTLLRLPGDGCVSPSPSAGATSSDPGSLVAISPDSSRVHALVTCSVEDSVCPGGTSYIQYLMSFDGRSGELLEMTAVGRLAAGNLSVSEMIAVSDDHVAIRTVDTRGGAVSPEQVTVYTRGHEVVRVLTGLRSETPGTVDPAPAAALTDDPALVVAVDAGVIRRFALTRSADGEWEDSTLLDVGTLDDVSALGLSSSGITAVGFDSGRVELWEEATGAYLVEAVGQDSAITALAIGQGAHGLVVTSTGAAGDGMVRVLDDADRLRAALCGVAARDLTPTEWQRAGGSGDPQSCRRGLD